MSLHGTCRLDGCTRVEYAWQLCRPHHDVVRQAGACFKCLGYDGGILTRHTCRIRHLEAAAEKAGFVLVATAPILIIAGAVLACRAWGGGC